MKSSRGVTLVELLIVILVMLMVTAITVPAIAPALKGRKIREAARMLDVFVNSAKAKAMAAGHPVGIAFRPDANGGVTQVFQVEQPPGYTGDYATSTIMVTSHGGTIVPPIVAPATTSSIFPRNDIGWVENVHPGDLIIFNGNTLNAYRIYLGEPYIDVNGDGVFTNNPSGLIEPWYDVDGDGVYGAAPNSVYNPDGTLNMTAAYMPLPTTNIPSPPPPQNVYGCICFAPADETLMAKICDFKGGTYNANNPPTYTRTQETFGPAGTRIKPGTVNFSITRQPILSSSTNSQLPSGTCIDLGYRDSNGNVIPGSGCDFFTAGMAASNANSAYLATFLPPSNASSNPDYTNWVYITFDPSGRIDRVYSFDPPTYSRWMGRQPTHHTYLLVGQTEYLGGKPDAGPNDPKYNMQEPSSLWLSINYTSGVVSVTENAPPDLTLSYFLQAYNARSLARDQFNMSGR